MTDVREASTARVRLRVPSQADLTELFALYSDPRVWAADPVSRHVEERQTELAIQRWRRGWEDDDQGMWVARTRGEGHLVGVGGCFVRYGTAWNLGFRLMPEFWRQGYAQEIGRAAIAAALLRRPELPVTAFSLEANASSHRTIRSLGLLPTWRGPDAGNPDPNAIRVLYADRPLEPRTLRALTER